MLYPYAEFPGELSVNSLTSNQSTRRMKTGESILSSF